MGWAGEGLTLAGLSGTLVEALRKPEHKIKLKLRCDYNVMGLERPWLLFISTGKEMKHILNA